MLERLRAGELDLCLLTAPTLDAPDVVAHRLDVQKLRLVVPADHRLATRKRIRLAEAADETFVTLEPGYGLRSITDNVCKEAWPARRSPSREKRRKPYGAWWQRAWG